MKFYTSVAVHGDNICSKEIVNGKRIRRKIPYQPTLFVNSKSPTQYKSLSGQYLDTINPGSLRETREFLREYEGVTNFEIYGNTNFQYTWINEEYPEETVDYDISQVRIFSLDIETESEKGFPNPEVAQERINAITLKDVSRNHFYVFGLEVYGSRYIPDKPNVTYLPFDNEEDFLITFMDKWRELDPDVITGWNVAGFDIPYLVNRINNLLGEGASKKLSPWGQIRASSYSIKMHDFNTYSISGVAILDYYRMYQKYVLDPRESYKLGHIAFVELGKTKVDHEEYATFKEFYQNDYPKYIAYNIEDSILVEELEAKLKLIDLTLMVAYQCHVNYEDVISQVRSWDTLIYNHLKRKGIIIPFKKTSHKGEQFVGAYVKVPKPGMYKWVVSFDVTSLYPSIILALNIGIETKMDFKWNSLDEIPMLNDSDEFRAAFKKASEGNWALGTNGIYYSKEHVSFYSEMIKKLFDDRVEYRKQAKICKTNGDVLGEAKFDLKQKATKIQMNSLYGAMGSQYFRFFDIENAEAVTLTGKFIIQFIERGMNQYLNKVLKTLNKDYVIYCDTDSVYLALDDLVKTTLPDETDNVKISSFLNKVCENHLEKELDRMFTEITSSYLNGMPGHLKMKREVIANQGIWLGKKRYILNCYDIEGEKFGLVGKSPDKKHAVPKLKFTGVEIKKAVIPKFCRDKMEDAVRIMMDTGDNDKLIDMIEEVRVKYNTLSVDEIGLPKGVHELTKYNVESGFMSKTPLHVRAALCYNRLIADLGLELKYQAIQNGEKIKYSYLKLPNPTKDKVIGFIQKLPLEFGLEKYIDYDLMFSKSFLAPLGAILDAIGWTIERKSSLSKWF